ncbi:MAG: 50S ribosomal protein L6 [Peptococcaceae bacterium]|jgi:large subunit ribosomal protein L6|nr:50S ribosomal protein L6 [Peptococcaceae bacterium]
MSRIGKLPVNVPAGVDVIIDGKHIKVKGPKGVLERDFQKDISVVLEDSQIVVTRPNDEKRNRAFHGLTRALIQNMVTGVSAGYERSLDMVGVGYRAQMQGAKLVLAIGYSHPVEVEPPEGLSIEVPAPTKILVKGADKQAVGQLAADIRKLRAPEPYKGKGIRYSDETVRIKAGKTGKKK